MKARLLILLVVVGGLAIYLLSRPTTSSVDYTPPDNEDTTKYEDQIELAQRKAPPGNEPAVPPEFAVRHEVDTASGKNRIKFAISEKHGYYVETMNLECWYITPGGSTKKEDSKRVVPHRINDYLEAKKTFEGHFEIVPAELSTIGGNIGKTENWMCGVVWHHRAREKNPDPLPKMAGRSSSGE